MVAHLLLSIRCAMISIPTSRELFFRGGASKVITRRRQNADGIAAKHFFLARVRA